MSVRPSTILWILLAAILSIGIAICIAHPAVQGFIENSGVNIPTENIVRDYAWGVFTSIVLLLSICLWPVPAAHKKMLAGAWLVKSVVALVIMLPYEERYWGADCWTYFQRAHYGLDGFFSAAAPKRWFVLVPAQCSSRRPSSEGSIDGKGPSRCTWPSSLTDHAPANRPSLGSAQTA